MKKDRSCIDMTTIFERNQLTWFMKKSPETFQQTGIRINMILHFENQTCYQHFYWVRRIRIIVQLVIQF